MKQNITRLGVCVALFVGIMSAAGILLTGCMGSGTAGQDYPQNDSIIEVVTNYLLAEEYDRARMVIDSAEAAGTLSHVSAEIERAHVLASDEATVAEVQTRCAPLLELDLTLDEQAEVLDLLIYAARLRDDDARLLQYGMQYIDLCHQMGESVKALATQARMGAALIRLGRTEEGMQAINEAIEQADGVRQFAALDAGILAKKSMIRALLDAARYDEAIPFCESIITYLQDYEAQPEVYADGSNELPTDERRPGYIDFYRGQAYAFMAYAYASLVESPKSKVESQAREALRLFEQTNYSNTFNGKKLISSTWFMLDQYDRLLPFYDELQTRWGTDTIHGDYAVMLKNRALIADERGIKTQSADYWKRFAALQNQLHNAERLAAAQESAARFHEQEQQYALEQAEAQKRRITLIAVTLAAGVVLITLFVVLLVYQLRMIRRKNDVLSQEIAENVRNKAQYLTLKWHPELPSEQKDRESMPALDGMNDAELFEFLRTVIVNEQLYLDPQFSRQQLMDRFGLRKERIGAAFARGSKYGSLPAFINECRLAKSVRLLTEEPQMTIGDIAAACGYANLTTFLSNFKQRYTLTPSEFRSQHITKAK
ncbi:MAG: AraC family transcriptional regulator [Paludibacteraceae bacterium]|nr:AraC family transcriptional regulator [Paludibacteraceae bacterium]